jgi:hypothetical protein
MDRVYKGQARAAVVVRVVAVALVLACLTPQRMMARPPAPAIGDRASPSAALSVEDWTAIQARLAQAGAHAPLVTGQVAKLTADDGGIQDYLGYAVAISGDTAILGAPLDDDGEYDSGSAYVFGRNQDGADGWGQVQKLTASDAAADDNFGWSVAISGDTVVVGAYGDDDGGDDSGSAYVFERNQGGADNWGQVQKLTASDAAADDYFGWSVAISGDTVVVGAYGDDDGGGGSGSAYVFERNQGGADNWGQVQKLTASDAAANDVFGRSVAISGDTVVVGAPFDGDGGLLSGSAYVFERNYDPSSPGTPLADNWGQVQKLTASDAALKDMFGQSVAVSGDTVVVGAYGDDGYTGSAYVFGRNQDGADGWGQVQKLTVSDAAADDHFGRSVAVSGDTAVVGAPFDDDSGSAYVFERNQGGVDNWGQVQKLTASDAAADDNFGWSVVISEDTVVVGAYGDDDGGDASGAAYVFARQGATWAQQQKPTAGDAAPSDVFGTSVAISDDTLVGGAPGDEGIGSAYLFYRNQDGADQWGQVRKKHTPALPAGADFGASVAIDVDTAVVGAPDADKVYIFERNDSGADLWGHVRTLTGTIGAAFGHAVSISGDTAVVGAPYDDDACSNCGAAYVYERNYDPGNPGTPLADNWGLRAVLTATVGPADGDQFGYSVAISGDAGAIVVGARQDAHSGKDQAGSVYVFKRNEGGADSWGLVRNLTASDSAAYDWFGHAVAISGDTFVVGAPYDDGGTGSVYFFERNHEYGDGWGQVQKVTADDGATADWFGWSVGFSGDTVVVGAPYDDDGGNASGSAYLLKRNENGADSWGQVEKLIAGDAAAEDEFGWSVGVSGNTVVVGARYDDDGGDGSGSTYVFRWSATAVYLPLVLKN